MFAGIILNNGNIGSNYLIQATANLQQQLDDADKRDVAVKPIYLY
jgi:hypothetical protein